jgi:putative inorganic carbon (HCO3(-)) transporter
MSLPDQGSLGPPPGSPPASEMSWLGIPSFEWSLPLLGLCVFTFAVVTYYFPVGEVGIAIAAAGLLLRVSAVRLPSPVWIFGAFMLWAFFSSLASLHAATSLDNVVERLKVLAIVVIIVNALQTEGQIRLYLMFFLGCFVLFPVRGTLVGGDDLSGRAVWNYIYRNPNDLATLCLIALGMALGFIFAKPSSIVVRVAGVVSAMLLVVVILLTQSRGAFIGLVAGMGPALVWSGLKRPGRLLVGAGILALVVGQFVPDKVWDRFAGIEKLTDTSTIAQADREGSAEERFEIQKVAWTIFLDNPVLGVGLGTYAYANARYAPEIGTMDTHNTYLNLAAEVGLPGFVLWCALVFSVLRYAYRTRRDAPPGPLATQQAWLERTLWAYLVASVFGSYSKLTFVYIVLATLWCSANVLASRSARDKGAAATAAAGAATS